MCEKKKKTLRIPAKIISILAMLHCWTIPCMVCMLPLWVLEIPLIKKPVLHISVPHGNGCIKALPRWRLVSHISHLLQLPVDSNRWLPAEQFRPNRLLSVDKRGVNCFVGDSIRQASFLSLAHPNKARLKGCCIASQARFQFKHIC